MYKPLKEHKSGVLGNKLAKIWESEIKAYEKRIFVKEVKENKSQKYDVKTKVRGPSLKKCLFKCFGLQLICYGLILAVMEISLRYV